MISIDPIVGELISSPTRQIYSNVTVYDVATNSYITAFTHGSNLKSFQVDRIGDSSKFFGFGICQKANIKILDPKVGITGSFSDKYFRIYFQAKGSSTVTYPFPPFHTTEVHRDENTGELSITAYDKLYQASTLTVNDIAMPEAPYTMGDVLDACMSALGISDWITSYSGTDFQEEYATGANLEGTETIRDVLDDIAEATQTVYFLNGNEFLVFKKLSNTTKEAITLTKDNYFTLKSGDNRRLSTIYSTTELGNDVYVTTGQTGTTQYVRDNAFWDVREDIDVVLQKALDSVGNLTINQFECAWRGDYRLEICDKIAFVKKDGTTITSYVLNDTITYDGSLSQRTEWKFEDNATETSENPATLGESLKKTYAKVDKVNKEIEIVASETDANTAEISVLKTDTSSIQATVERVETINNTLNELSNGMAELTTAVNAKMTNEQVQIEIEKALDDGVEKVETATGFTFDESGLTIEKSDSETNTRITENGMYVYIGDLTINEDGTVSGEIKLTANKEGVKAEDLHATTYLIIGTNSRFENYGSDRTGCFWIGG